jgi:hypothetical protein
MKRAMHINELRDLLAIFAKYNESDKIRGTACGAWSSYGEGRGRNGCRM